jgi:hypothetical protein
MPRIPKTELSPDNGCIIDMKWQLGPLSYHASAAGKEPVPLVTQSTRLPEIVLYDRSKRRVAILSRRLLQGALLGSRPRLLRKFLCRKRPRRCRQLLSVHRTDLGATRDWVELFCPSLVRRIPTVGETVVPPNHSCLGNGGGVGGGLS